MSEYNELVEMVKHRIHAEKWGQETEYLLAQHGYIEIAKRDGSVVRTYHRDVDGHKAGEVIFVEQAMSQAELELQAPSA
jgi:hypothetical protein